MKMAHKLAKYLIIMAMLVFSMDSAYALKFDIFKITKVWENLNSAQISEITPVKAVQFQVLKHLTLGRIFLPKKQR